MSSGDGDRSDGGSEPGTPGNGSEIAFGDPAAEGGQEKALELQLSRLKRKLREARSHCDRLRKANEELQDESARIRVESHEYMSYIDKKVKKRETMVLTLNAKNMRELEEIANGKKKLMEEFLKEEQDAQEEILQKEVEFASVRRELDELDHLREARSAQEKQIRDLKAELEMLHMSHTERRHSMKMSFVLARKQFEDEAKAAIAKLQMEASTDAEKQVLRRTEAVRRNNIELRDKVKYFVDECKALERKRVNMTKRVSGLEAEIGAQKQLNQFRFGTPVASATQKKPRKAPSSRDRVELSLFAPDRREFSSDGSARAAALDMVSSSTRRQDAETQASSARARAMPGDPRQRTTGN